VGRKLILDTTALIELDRSGAVPGLLPGDEIAIASISLGEIYRGVIAANKPELKRQRQEFFDELVADDTIDVLPYTEHTARAHGFLLDYTQKQGKPRGAYDIVIAAHARETGRAVFSADLKARFGDLPGVSLVSEYK
jgi:predicted nucleic acid-binding protein